MQFLRTKSNDESPGNPVVTVVLPCSGEGRSKPRHSVSIYLVRHYNGHLGLTKECTTANLQFMPIAATRTRARNSMSRRRSPRRGTQWGIPSWVRLFPSHLWCTSLTCPAGLGTAADSINWVGYLTTQYNDTTVLSYNHAVYGATVNNSIVASDPDVPQDLVYQVLDAFEQNYCPPQSTGLGWSADAALFVVWIGINE